MIFDASRKDERFLGNQICESSYKIKDGIFKKQHFNTMTYIDKHTYRRVKRWANSKSNKQRTDLLAHKSGYLITKMDTNTWMQ